jgi:hypothetical protein
MTETQAPEGQLPPAPGVTDELRLRMHLLSEHDDADAINRAHKENIAEHARLPHDHHGADSLESDAEAHGIFCVRVRVPSFVTARHLEAVISAKEWLGEKKNRIRAVAWGTLAINAAVLAVRRDRPSALRVAAGTIVVAAAYLPLPGGEDGE